MKAAVLYAPHEQLKVEEFECEEPGPTEVLVKIGASGVCHSDWHVIKGEWDHVPLPSILGHEGAGVVEAVGTNVVSVQVGDHVILSWKSSCGICEVCQKGWPNLCVHGPVASSKLSVNGSGVEVDRMGGMGTFAEYQIVPEIGVVVIGKDIPMEQASLVGCGVMTGVGAAINTARIQPGSTVAVFGAGGVGLNCIQGASIAGATTIVAVDMLDNKLDMSREFGATHTVNASRDDPVPRIKEITGGKGAHYAFEAIGLVEEPFIQSILCTRSRGVTVWVGHPPKGTKVAIDPLDLIMEKTVVTSLYGSARPQIDFPRLISLYRSGKLKLDELVSRTFKLEEVNSAFKAMSKGEVARGVLTF